MTDEIQKICEKICDFYGIAKGEMEINTRKAIIDAVKLAYAAGLKAGVKI
jgi:hypothetical protein